MKEKVVQREQEEKSKEGKEGEATTKRQYSNYSADITEEI